MLHQISSHGLFDLKIKAIGDIHIDDHHTNEDVGIALRQSILKSLRRKKRNKQIWTFFCTIR